VTPDLDAWVIESWKDPVLILKHGRNTYKATFNENLILYPDGKAPRTSSHCFLAMDQFGHVVQPASDGKLPAGFTSTQKT
jgi:hypothetical protein